MFTEISALIAQQLTDNKATVSVAESSTGGLISANLLAIPGASRFFVGGSVIYTHKSRRTFLSIDREKLKLLEPLSEDMVQQFAHAARRSLDTTWGVAELGATGPTGTPYGHGPGVSVIGVSGPVNATLKVETNSEDRQQNMMAFTEAALELFAETLGRVM